MHHRVKLLLLCHICLSPTHLTEPPLCKSCCNILKYLTPNSSPEYPKCNDLILSRFISSFNIFITLSSDFFCNSLFRYTFCYHFSSFLMYCKFLICFYWSLCQNILLLPPFAQSRTFSY